MNTNRNNSNNSNNNRRRGRSNNPSNRGGSGGGGGGNPANRIDSRARGNAPQMLEKYKKLAHDASLNDDRVQTEYYLQFADHYFRVMADIKAQKDEAQARHEASNPARRERDDNSDDDREYSQEDRQNERSQDHSRDRSDTSRRPRVQYNNRNEDGESNFGENGEDTPDDENSGNDRPNDNPFIRESRQSEARQADARQAKPARPRPRRKPADDAGDDRDEPSIGLDPVRLPPSITRSSEDESATGNNGDEATPAPRKPRVARAKAPLKLSRPRRAAPDDDGESGAGNFEAAD